MKAGAKVKVEVPKPVQQPAAQLPTLPQGYAEFVTELKAEIRSAQVRAALSVNRELVLLYWNVGRQIINHQEREGWGAKVIDRLSHDLQLTFPEMKGFSVRNIKYMQKIAFAYRDLEFVQQVVAQIPWGHNVFVLDLVHDSAEREWYIRETIEHGWSRNVLVHQIESGLYHRKGKTLTNFEHTLPSPQSELAQQILKDPYNFDFLSLGEDVKERDLHRGLLAHLREFLLELGVGFSFVGSEYHLEVDGEDYHLDLLFYHLRLRCFVVIELKVGKFKPEYTGKMNFYLSAVDDLLRHETDHPTVGLILCKDRSRVIVEYSLRDSSRPMGVAAYRFTQSLPATLQDNLPTVEELQAELSGETKS
ncbi:MAG TPA: PDDEXK nuclease domain-containing protein [bacterium]|jgi:predicted nuclease of restriction endonuclease-like (RecB) superfamily